MRPGDWIRAFRPAEGPPPRRLGAFLGWCLSGAWPMLGLAAAASARGLPPRISALAFCRRSCTWKAWGVRPTSRENMRSR